jgi:anaerobic glycerol-3-phosphate dehydrogenase
MNSHRFDVVVVGAGLGGLIAAGSAARQNLRVALVATGPGRFVLGSGCLKAHEFNQAGSKHEMAEAIRFFCEMAQAAGCPFDGDIAEVRSLPTILGDFDSVALAPRSLWNAEPRSGASTAIVGIRELSCFVENFMSERLNERVRRLGIACNYAARRISLSHIFSGPVTTLRLAMRFDSDPSFRSELASALRPAAPGFERILVPGMLGLHSSWQHLAQFENELGCALGELPTLPPSVCSLRLFHRLLSHLQGIGVELFQGFPVQAVEIQNGNCTELRIANPGRPTILHGECVVLAAGQHSAELFGGTFARHDEQMHPLTSSGSVVAWNLFVAESGAFHGTEGSGGATEILAGYCAGNLAAATRGHYAAR